MIEAVLTFFLVWVIFATAADPRGTFASIAGLAIGFTITLDVFMGGPYTGAAMNPARAVGPELVQNFWTDGWVYWVGPLIGAGLAALAYDRLYLRPLSPEPVGPPETGLDEPRPGDAAATAPIAGPTYQTQALLQMFWTSSGPSARAGFIAAPV